MRLVWPALAVTAGIAHADTPWSEYGAATRMQRMAQLAEAGCDIDVTLRGAIVEVEVRQRLKNTGLEPLAATRELALPAGAQLVALEVAHGTRKAQSALAVNRAFRTERVSDPDVLGADPAVLYALGDRDQPRFRIVVSPLETEQEAVITTRWTRTADIHGGALHVTLPAHEGKPCRGVLHATPGPGTSIARVRFAGVESAVRTFSLADTALPIAVDLAFKKSDPVVWTQHESLGDGFTARALTILTPPAKAPVARRVLFVIDGSRSMEIVGRHRVKQLVRAIGATLVPGTGVEAIVYDRTAQRVFGAWHPVDAQQLTALETAIATRTPGNGSDAAAALALARQAIADAEGYTLIVLVTDGVFGEMAETALADALGSPPQVGLQAIVLSRGRLDAPDVEPVETAIRKVEGGLVAIDIEQLDTALATLDEWLRPSWFDLELAGAPGREQDDSPDAHPAMPNDLRAGSGIVLTTIVKRPRKAVLNAHTDKPIKIAAVNAPAAPIAELALASASPEQLGTTALARLRARHPAAGDHHAFVVLASAGKVAKIRREVAASGGPFTRMVAIADPAFPPDVRTGTAASGGGSAIDRPALELMFRTQLQPAAFACYRKAIALRPTLAGTVKFRIEIGRGETTRATVVTGLGEPTLDTCLLDAAYRVTPALPNPDYNTDDRVIANYPLTFSVREQKPFVLPGDADSQSPLDIEAIRGGLPVTIKAGDTSTPLGNLKVPKSP